MQNRSDDEGHAASQSHNGVPLPGLRVALEVVDQGSGFDLARCVADPTTPDNLQREQGRGLFLMLKLMDRVERFDQQGNVVRLTLNRG